MNGPNGGTPAGGGTLAGGGTPLGGGRRRDFTGLMTAEAVSLLGSRMTFVALPWLVLVTTGSATRTGIVAFAEMVPLVVANAIGGPLVDRLGPRRASIGFDAVSVVVVASVPLLHDAGRLSFAALVGLVAVAGALRGLGDTAKRVLFGVVAARAGVEMTRATALQDGLSRATALLGAPVAGLLVAALGAAHVLLLDAASFGLAALLVLGQVRTARASTVDTSTPEVAESYVEQLRAGVAFIRRDRLVLGIMVMLFVTNLIDQAQGSVLVPVWAKEVFGSPLGIGLISASFALGAVGGNLVYTAMAPRLPRWAPFAVGFLIGGAPRLVTLAINSPLWTILTVSVAAGVALSVVNPILGAVGYERVPPRLQARVLGLITALSWAGIPLGGLLGGWLADHAGLRPALLICAGIYLVATLLPFTGRFWRQMDDRPTPLPAPAPATATA